MAVTVGQLAQLNHCLFLVLRTKWGNILASQRSRSKWEFAAAVCVLCTPLSYTHSDSAGLPGLNTLILESICASSLHKCSLRRNLAQLATLSEECYHITLLSEW